MEGLAHLRAPGTPPKGITVNSHVLARRGGPSSDGAGALHRIRKPASWFVPGPLLRFVIDSDVFQLLAHLQLGTPDRPLSLLSSVPWFCFGTESYGAHTLCISTSPSTVVTNRFLPLPRAPDTFWV